MDIKEIAKTLRDQLKKYHDFKGLYLYGSQLTPNKRNDSDIDIVAVFDTPKDYDIDVHGEAYELELLYDVVIDFHTMTLNELEKNSIYFREVQKGLYYAR